MKYIINAWYRYAGASEKDFDYFEIEAATPAEAKAQLVNPSQYFNIDIKDEIQVEKERFYSWMENIKSIHLAHHNSMMEAFEKIEQHYINQIEVKL